MKLMSKGDRKAFMVLYDRYYEKMRAFFKRMLWGDEELARDFTQTLFLKLIAKPEYFDPSRSFATWIYALARNMVKNEYRHRSRNPSPIPIENTLEEGSYEAETGRPDQTDYNQQINVALKYLNEKQRICFVLRYYEQLSIQEISTITDTPEGTVKSRLFHAIQIMAKKVQQAIVLL